MRRIAAVSVGRSDVGIISPVLELISQEPDLDLSLFIGGMHLAPRFGSSFRELEDRGFRATERIEMLVDSDTPEGISKSVGLGVIGFSQAISRHRPDLLLVVGDRFEMFSAVFAALPFGIPVAHIHGGELTMGAIDDALRHSITKLSHLHFVSTPEYADRVIQMGENPEHVFVTGSPSLDNLRLFEALSGEDIEKRLGAALPDRFLLVTLHPETLDYDSSSLHVEEVLAALDRKDLPIVFTGTNADTGHSEIRHSLRDYVRRHKDSSMFESLGSEVYFSLMEKALAMVGNSSSGIIEAPSFALPVVNVGDRQKGRVRALNVIDVAFHRDAISAAIDQAISPSFQAGIRDLENPYGDGRASERIVEVLKKVPLDRDLIRKAFYDLPKPWEVAR